MCVCSVDVVTGADDPTAAMKSLALIAAEPFSAAPVESEKTFHHIVDHHNGHYLLKRLIMNDAERIKTAKTGTFYNPWCCN